jgi:ubiquitin C-terminal hydrolase
MFAVPEFRQYYESAMYKKVKVRQPMVKDLKFSRVMENLSLQIDKIAKSHVKRVILTSDLRKMIKEEFSPVMEHDSHEFLLYFLNGLKDELTEKGTKLPLNTKL